MDTQLPLLNKPAGIYTQMPPNIEAVKAFDAWKLRQGWQPTGWDYYNPQTKTYKTVAELYSMFTGGLIK